MKIDSSNGQFYYDLFYQISFLLVFIIYLFEGYKRKFPWSTWLLVIVTVRIFFIIGSKFGAITQDDFSYFTQHIQFPAQHYTNLTGALVVGLIGIAFAKLMLQIKYPILDAFAIAAPFGMAVQRIGCLMVGCCYGTETHLPWGIQYGVNTPAFMNQFNSHQVNFNDQLSHFIHPVPLYFIISCLLTGVVVLLLRHHFKRQGNLSLFSLLLLLASRFIIEFFRDPHSNGSLQGSTLVGMKTVQIFCLLAVFILTSIIIIREKQFKIKEYSAQIKNPLLNASYLFMLTVVIYTTRKWFNDIEFYVLIIALIPAALSVINDLIANYFTSLIRISTLFLLVFSLLIMSQSNPKPKSTGWQSIRVGYSGGEYSNRHDVGMGTGCDRHSLSQDFKQKYQLGGIGYSVVKKDSSKVFEYGLNGYFGSHTETGLTSGVTQSNQIWGFNPYFNYDRKWLGAGLGFHVGDLRLTPDYWVEQGSVILPKTGTLNTIIYPQIYARLGIERILYLSYHLGNNFPSPFPIFYNYMEIGSGFGFRNGFKVSLGANIDAKTFIKAKIPVSNLFIIEPVYQWGVDNTIYGNKYNQFSIGFSYLFAYHTD